jgi:hypothetical protein
MQVSTLSDETKESANFAMKEFKIDPGLFGDRKDGSYWEKYDTSMRDLESTQKKRPLESCSSDDKKQKNICNKLSQNCDEISPKQQFNFIQNCNENIPLDEVQNCIDIENSPLVNIYCSTDSNELQKNKEENTLSSLTDEELEVLIPSEILKNINTEEECKKLFKNSYDRFPFELRQ